MSKAQIIDIFNQFKAVNFHEFAVVTQIENKVGLKFITNRLYSNISLRFHRNVKSLDQLFYDKGINQQDLMISSHFELPFSSVSEDGQVSGMILKYVTGLCESINASCELQKKNTKDTDIILNFYLNQIYYTTNGPKNFMFSYPVGFRHLCVLVPKGEIINGLLNLFPVIYLGFKIGVPILFVMCALYWYFIIKGTPFEKNLFDIYFFLFEMLITNSLYKSPKLSTERVFCLSFIFVSLTFICGYTSNLISLLVAPKCEKDINSMAELQHMKLTVIYPFEHGFLLFNDHMLRNATDYFSRYFISSYIYNLTFPTQKRRGIFLEHTHNRSLSQMVDCQVAENFIKSKANYISGSPRYHIMGEQLILGHKSFLTRNRSPFMKYVNLMNAKLIESGIWNFWVFEQQNESSLESEKKIIENKDIFQSETIIQLSKFFLVCYGTAFIAFFCEVIHFKISKYLKKRFT